MHIRLLALGTQGDVQPCIALGLGLQQVGYEVSVGTTRDFKAFVESFGLKCMASERDVHSLVMGQGGKRPRGRKAKWDFFRLLLDETFKLSQGADLLVYGPALIFSAPHVAEKLKVPAIPALLQPFMTPTRDFPAVGTPYLPLGGGYNRFTYDLLDSFLWLFLRGQINKWRVSELGLPPCPQPGIFTPLRSADIPTLYGFSSYVLPKPAEWGQNVHVTGYWFLPASAWQPSVALTQFLDAGPAPVYVGFGSMAGRDPVHTARIVFEAVQKAGVRAIVAAGWGGLAASDLPSNVFALESAPHDWLFPRMAAAVHHGGAGTTAASLRAGIPTLVIPFKSDQPFWGKRVALAGAGPQPVPHRQLTVERLAQALILMQDESMRSRAEVLGRQIRSEDGVASAVQVIQQATGRSRSERRGLVTVAQPVAARA